MKRIKQLLAGCTAAALLTLGLTVAASSAAVAEDTPPPEVAVETVAPEVVVEEPEAPPADTASPIISARLADTVVKVTICHKPGTPAEQEEKQVPESAVQGHLDHGDILGACPERSVAVDTDFIVAAWLMHSWVGPNQADFSEDQILKKTSDPLEEKDLTILDSWLAEQKCGLAFQIDGYIYSVGDVIDTDTQTLLAGAVLHGPNDPTEHLWGGGWGEAYKVYYTGDCEEVTNVVCETYTDGGTATNLDANGWYDSDTRSKGHAVYVDGGLAIHTDPAAGESPDQRKVQWEKDVADFPLWQTGQVEIDYDSTSGNLKPGVKERVDFDGDGDIDGTLVAEPKYADGTTLYGADWWLTNDSDGSLVAPQTGGGFGSTRHGTIDEWLTVYPDAVVKKIQFGIGSGVDAAGVLHSFSIGCATYSFDREDIPVVVELGVTGPEAQCGVAGQLPTLPTLEHIDLSVSPEGTGPGIYTVTATAHTGYVISGQAVFEIVVPEALPYQNTNAEGACFIEPKPNVVVDGEPECDDTTFPQTTTVFTLDPVTGEYDAGVSTTLDVPVTEVEECPSEGELAFTGATTGNLLPLGAGLLAIGVLIGGGVLVRRMVLDRKAGQ